MGDILYYDGRRKRNEFKEGLKVDINNHSNKRQENDRVSYIGDRIAPGTPKQRINNRRLKRAAELYASLPEEEKIWIQKRRIKQAESRRFKQGKIKGYQIPEEHKRYTARKRAISIAMCLGLTGAMALGIFGATKGYEAYRDSQNGEQFEAIAQDIDSLEQLGVSKEIVDEIQSLQADLSSENINNLSNDELLSLGRRVENVQFDVLKGKLADTLGVNEDEIILSPKLSEGTATVRVSKGEGETIIYNTGDFLDRNNNISQEITDGILNLANTQTVNSKVENGEFDREGAIEQYKSGVTSAKDIATKEISMDENGNISLSPVSQQEIDELIQDNDEER